VKTRTGLFPLLALGALILLLAGCNITPPVYDDMIGTWGLVFVWKGGTAKSVLLDFESDGTWTTPSEEYEAYGTWEIDGSNVTFTYLTGFMPVYTGTVNAELNYMSGTMLDDEGHEGTWKARHRSAKDLDGFADLPEGSPDGAQF